MSSQAEGEESALSEVVESESIHDIKWGCAICTELLAIYLLVMDPNLVPLPLILSGPSTFLTF